MKKKAIIVSIKGATLSNKERLLFSNEKPWGLILFRRNIASLNQLQSLIKDIRILTKDIYFPILIDEEGLTVSRLKKLIQHDISANYFGGIYLKNKRISICLYKTLDQKPDYLEVHFHLSTYHNKLGKNIKTDQHLKI